MRKKQKKIANSQKFYRLVLGLVGLIDAKGIDLSQPMYMAVRLSDIRAKTGKKCNFEFFFAFFP